MHEKLKSTTQRHFILVYYLGSRVRERAALFLREREMIITCWKTYKNLKPTQQWVIDDSDKTKRLKL